VHPVEQFHHVQSLPIQLIHIRIPYQSYRPLGHSERDDPSNFDILVAHLEAGVHRYRYRQVHHTISKVLISWAGHSRGRGRLLSAGENELWADSEILNNNRWGLVARSV
jgi:hypothetical protein